MRKQIVAAVALLVLSTQFAAAFQPLTYRFVIKNASMCSTQDSCSARYKQSLDKKKFFTDSGESVGIVIDQVQVWENSSTQGIGNVDMRLFGKPATITEFTNWLTQGTNFPELSLYDVFGK